MEHECGVCEQLKDAEDLHEVASYLLCDACLDLLVGLLRAVCG